MVAYELSLPCARMSLFAVVVDRLKESEYETLFAGNCVDFVDPEEGEGASSQVRRCWRLGAWHAACGVGGIVEVAWVVYGPGRWDSRAWTQTCSRCLRL